MQGISWEILASFTATNKQTNSLAAVSATTQTQHQQRHQHKQNVLPESKDDFVMTQVSIIVNAQNGLGLYGLVGQEAVVQTVELCTQHLKSKKAFFRKQLVAVEEFVRKTSLTILTTCNDPMPCKLGLGMLLQFYLLLLRLGLGCVTTH